MRAFLKLIKDEGPTAILMAVMFTYAIMIVLRERGVV